MKEHGASVTAERKPFVQGGKDFRPVGLAVAKDGAVVYVQAYGDARLDPKIAAAPTMRYSIGSISKQFTAAAILMLQEQGKLSLDDKVARWEGDEAPPSAAELNRQAAAFTSGESKWGEQRSWWDSILDVFRQ